MTRRVRPLPFVLALAFFASAQTPRNSMLVTAGWLHQNMRAAVILHVGDRASYDAGHIPGAVLVPMSSLLAERDGTPNELPPIETLENAFTAAGAGTRGRIVVYSTDPLHAARAWFTLDYLGQSHRVALLDGGYAAWVAHGYPVSQEAVAAKPAAFESRVAPETMTRLATMRELVRLREQLGPNLVIVDARPVAQFDGSEAGADVKRAGRIPGAVNVPATANFAADGTFRSADELRALYERAGMSKESANVVYCRTGMQASVTYFVLRYLGYDATLYDGSYLEWSNAGEMIWSR